MKKQKLTLAAGAAFAASFALSPMASAGDNPFGMQKLDGGYQLAQADKKMDGKCGGDKMPRTPSAAADKKADGKCGADKAKDGKCGADKKAMDKKKDGKCGEGKCGADKKK
jgi:uncharacterized low-complexity protein